MNIILKFQNSIYNQIIIQDSIYILIFNLIFCGFCSVSWTHFAPFVPSSFLEICFNLNFTPFVPSSFLEPCSNLSSNKTLIFFKALGLFECGNLNLMLAQESGKTRKTREILPSSPAPASAAGS